MSQYVQGICMILSLVNPVIRGAMFSKATAGKSGGEQIADATRAAMSITVILCFAAFEGAQLLKAFGI